MWARDICGSTNWALGLVVQRIGSLTYMVQLDDKSYGKGMLTTPETEGKPKSMQVHLRTSTDNSQSSDPPFIPFTSPTELSSSSEATPQPTTKPSLLAEQHNLDIPTSQVLAPWRNPF